MTSNQAAYSLAIGNGGEVAVGPGAILSITSDFSLDGGTLSVDPNGAFYAGGTVTIDADASLSGGPISAGGYQLNDGAVGADLTGPGGLTKGNGSTTSGGPVNQDGSPNNPGGTVVLSGDNSYAGGTVVNAGTLVVASANALPVGSSLAVGAGASMLFGASQLSNAQVVGLVASVPDTSSAPVVASVISTLSPVPASQVENTPNTAVAAPTSPAAVSTGQDALARPADSGHDTVDAVFVSHWPVDRSVLPAENPQPASSPLSAGAIESFWNSPDHDKMMGKTVGALDEVLARFGL